MEALVHFITGFGVIAVLSVIFAESGLLIGFFLPGDSLLFVSGYLVAQGTFAINVHLFVLLLWIAAVLGDSTGYAFGHKVGRKLFERENSRFFKKKYLEQAEAFFQKHGPIAIFLARFVPIVRTFTPIVAGASKMHYRTFVAFNIIGGLLWTASFTYLGYFLGKVLIDAGINVEIIAIIIVFLSVLPMIIHAIKSHGGIKGMWNVTKKQIEVIRGKRKKL